MAQTQTAEGATDKATAEAGSKAKPQRKRITRRKAVEEKVRSYFDAMDARDANAMAAHWREDGVEDVVPVGLMRGRDELRDFFASMFAAMPDARTTVTRLIAGEQSCAVEWRLEGTFDGAPYTGLQPTGNHVEIRGLRAPDRHAARRRLRRRSRHEERVQRRDEAAPRDRGAPPRLMAVFVALVVGLVWWITAWAFGIKAVDAFLLTAALVVSAAAFQMVKPFLDQLLGREVAEPEEQGAGF